MVREARLLWDNPAIGRQDFDRLRRLENGWEPSAEPLPRSQHKTSSRSSQERRRQRTTPVVDTTEKCESAPEQ